MLIVCILVHAGSKFGRTFTLPLLRGEGLNASLQMPSDFSDEYIKIEDIPSNREGCGNAFWKVKLSSNSDTMIELHKNRDTQHYTYTVYGHDWKKT